MIKNIILASLTFLLLFACEKALIGPEPENTPIGNYDVLWKTLDEKYPLFSLKHINWDSLNIVYRNQINTSTTESELWNICGKLISHLNDGHITLFNRNYTDWLGSQTSISNDKALGFNLNLVTNQYLDNVKVTGEGYLTYGKIKNSNIGYIYISGFHAAANGRFWVTDFDNVISDLYNTDAIIVDVRNNGGGLAVNDLYIASAFIDRGITYFEVRLKNGPGLNDFAEPVIKTISPRTGALSFIKNNVLLTNRFSASGSEVLASIFKNLDYSIQVGDTTNGSFGEVTQVAHLPNGWTFHYPCTLTTTPDGNSPEGIGVIPDIVIDNTKEDIDAGNDKVLQCAINHLSRKSRK